MNTLGERLRRRRISQGITLEQVAERTKIGARLLVAMEADEFALLPAGVFRRSFVRQYAAALEIPESEIAADVAALPLGEVLPELVAAQACAGEIPSLKRRSRFRRFLQPVLPLAGLVSMILLCAAAYDRWQRAPQVAPPAPARQAESLVRSGFEVAFRAIEPTWISVMSDGRQTFATALAGGAMKTVEASESVRVLVGNAGGLELSLNGKPVGPLGRRGEVRIVELTAAGAQIQMTPRKPAPAAEPL